MIDENKYGRTYRTEVLSLKDGFEDALRPLGVLSTHSCVPTVEEVELERASVTFAAR